LGAWDDAKDCRLYTDACDAWVAIQPGQFAVFFPEDAHLPLVGRGRLHKVVVKVAVAWDGSR
ncbi:MAG: YhcH/YjgK/YiaL family protein, partial [Candidatus Marinimicrobia bacterium]|nr:YhcH/YjgK/YiaL family protein [Candidatus Neomarinimicrobiota bacterium]